MSGMYGVSSRFRLAPNYANTLDFDAVFDELFILEKPWLFLSVLLPYVLR